MGQLSVVLPADLAVTDVQEELWGVPGASVHNRERVCSDQADEREGCASSAGEAPFITLPASCSEPLRTLLTVTSDGQPPVAANATALSRDSGGNLQPLGGCEVVPFAPRIAVNAENMAAAPSAVAIAVEVPQYEGARVIASAALRALRLEFPPGLTLNPASGSWLTGCSRSAVGLETVGGVSPANFNEDDAGCPGSSKVGSAKLSSPLVDHPIEGSINVAAPSNVLGGGHFAFYLVIEDAETGTILKIPGTLEADPSDGRLTALITELPQLPFGEMLLEFDGGSRATLVNPPVCGSYATEATLIPSTESFSPPVTRTSSLSLSRVHTAGHVHRRKPSATQRRPSSRGPKTLAPAATHP